MECPPDEKVDVRDSNDGAINTRKSEGRLVLRFEITFKAKNGPFILLLPYFAWDYSGATELNENKTETGERLEKNRGILLGYMTSHVFSFGGLFLPLKT